MFFGFTPNYSCLLSLSRFPYMKQGLVSAREHGGGEAIPHHSMLYRTSEWTLTAFLGMGTRTTTFVPAAVSGMSALTITTTSILHEGAAAGKERNGERGKDRENSSTVLSEHRKRTTVAELQ